MTPKPPHHTLWAKKSINSDTGELLWLSLVDHLKDCAEVAKLLWDEWLPEATREAIRRGIERKNGEQVDGDFARQLFVFLAACHDLGKASPVFQARKGIYHQRGVNIELQRKLDEHLHGQLKGAGLDMEKDYQSKSYTRHELVTYAILKKHGFNDDLAGILASHHGKPPSILLTNDIQDRLNCCCHCGFNKTQQSWQDVQEHLLNNALSTANFSSINELRNLKIKKFTQVLLSALVIMADWIASDDKKFRLLSLDGHVIAHKERAKQAWGTLDLKPHWKPPERGNWDDIYCERFISNTESEFKPRPLQETLIQTLQHDCLTPGIVVIEAAMGEGKTEAALAAAEMLACKKGCGGIYFALPSQATSNAMFKRIEDWLKEASTDAHSILLAHGKADFHEDYRRLKFKLSSVNIDDEDGNVVVHEWFSARKKTMLADFVVGTIDQLLLAGLKQKHVMLRHLGLANKIVIIDECHAYDTYMMSYLEMALNWLGAYKTPVIVLSATLPKARRKRLIEAWLNPKKPLPASSWADSEAYPLISYTDGDVIKSKAVLSETSTREVEIRLIAESDDIAETDKIVKQIAEILSDGGYAGIILNTVKRAQHFFNEFKRRFPEIECILLHSRFISPDRAKKENELRERLGPSGTPRSKPLIVVGTQVLEQSLDIDFDVLVTDLAPMDLVLQRIGRLHRHKRNHQRSSKLASAICYILRAGDEDLEEGAKSIYGEYFLMRTRALLQTKTQLLLPDDIPFLVQRTYEDADILLPEEQQEAYKRAKIEANNREEEQKSNARTYQIKEPMRTDQKLLNWLEDFVDNTGKRGEAAVRQGEDSIEVIVVEKTASGLRLLPWIGEEFGKSDIPTDVEPEDLLARTLASCMVRLPTKLTGSWIIDDVIKSLEKSCQWLGVWMRSPWLKGELFLFVEREGNDYVAELAGYRLYYSRELGLVCK